MSAEQPEGERAIIGKDSLATARRRFYQTITAIGVIVLIAGGFWLISQIWTPIALILFSAFIVFILHAPVDYLDRKGVPRALGTAIMYVVTVLVLAGIGLIFVPVVAEQLSGFISALPQYVQQAGAFLSQTFTQVNDYLEQWGVQNVLATVSAELAKSVTSLASNSATTLFSTASSIGVALVLVAVSFIVGFWVLKDLPRFRTEIYKLAGPRYSEDVRVVSGAFSRALGGYLKGMFVACVCTGTLTFIAYSIIGLPYPIVLALFTGLMVFIPFIGPILAWSVAGLVGLTISPLTGALAVVLTVASQISYDNLLAPRIMGSHVAIHPALVLVAIFTGAMLGGILGMLCAIPLAAALKSIFAYYFEKKTGRKLMSSKGAIFLKDPPPRSGSAEGAPGAKRTGNPVSRFFGFHKKDASGDEDLDDEAQSSQAQSSEAPRDKTPSNKTKKGTKQ
ncbi:MAG: AI-2E family transporter [Coriobacteriia bacterium]|nr:AI-2E family transporter [Coriobacteriia bacterium]